MIMMRCISMPAATSLFGYASDEIIDLDSTDLFVDDINRKIIRC